MRQKNLAIPATRVERFLKELVNLKRDSRAILRFLSRFRDMLTDLPSAQQWCEGPPGVRRQPGRLIYSSPGFEEEHMIGELSVLVMSMWSGPTLREKKARVLLLHRVISAWKPTFLLSAIEDVAPPGPFEQAILHLLDSADRAMVCGNPQCPAPYFFRDRTKRRQRYCSLECSGFGQRAVKRKWWADHGQQWRESQQTGKERKRGGKHGSSKAR